MKTATRSNSYKVRTVEEVRAALADRNIIVDAAAKKGTAERMPITPADARRPVASLCPLIRAKVRSLSSDGTRVDIRDDHGKGGDAAFADLLFSFDEVN